MSLRDRIKEQFLAGKMSEEQAFASMVAVSGADVARVEIKNWIVIKKNVDKT